MVRKDLSIYGFLKRQVFRQKEIHVKIIIYIMSKDGNSYARITIKNGVEFIVLGCLNKSCAGEGLEAWIAPSYGSNLCRFTYGRHNIIDADIDMLKKTFFPGTPVLYPFPNRMRDARFKYNGRVYQQIKDGMPVGIHGLVLNEAWEYDNPHTEKGCAVATTWIDFSKGTEIYRAFPFNHSLFIEYRLSEKGLCITYTVKNRDSTDIPFGFGLHPFFARLSGDEDTFCSIPANCVMENTEDLLPTGKLIDVEKTEFDLKNYTPVGAIGLDHVFTCLDKNECAQIYYKKQSFKLILKASEDFSHIVLFSPKGMDFFCIESQTCSTDAHNMYDKGFIKESGLEFVLPGQTKSGKVEYIILDSY